MTEIELSGVLPHGDPPALPLLSDGGDSSNDELNGAVDFSNKPVSKSLKIRRRGKTDRPLLMSCHAHGPDR
jgi:hypothetical protein